MCELNFFQEVVTEKYLKKHWKTEDLFSADKYEHLKKILRVRNLIVTILFLV